MTTESITTPTFTGHLIFNARDDFQRLTLNDTDAEMAQAEGLTVITNAGLIEILEHIGPTPATEHMDDQTWQALAPALKHLADTQEHPFTREPPSIHVVPLDTPDEILNMEVDALFRFYDSRVDLYAFVQISEIKFARDTNREPNPDLFKEASLAENFDDIYLTSLDELEQQAENADIQASEVGAEHAGEKAMYGDSPVGSQRIGALYNMDAKIMQYAVDHHPEGESPGLAPG
ncbi:hypothetical protein [Marinobacter sp. ELB17]|uniref:hypothetical protein n=1 Tax=Marinobacter sp. ELB17 TaxID=270374 RepID=UPI0000F36AAD|nr:hypothetical protein [Marinobacter sp. ELB17]EAZ97469.1 hypothetical protein MELB17_09988 [Marinobacter sp. ELB17]